MSQLQPMASAIEDEDGEKPSLIMGVIAGLLAAIIGAALWAVITMLTKFQIGYMAVGVGFLVGFAIRFAGRGKTIIYGIIGAALSLAGCLVGNFIALVYIDIGDPSLFMDGLKFLFAYPAEIIAFMQAYFSVLDLLFYGIAMYCGFRFSIVTDVKKSAAVAPPVSI